MSNGNPAAHIAQASRMWGIVLIVLGVLCIAAPFVAGAWATMLIGISILCAGVAMLLGAFQAEHWGTGIFASLVGLVTILAGGYMLVHPVLGLMTITLMLGLYFMFDGIFQVVGAFQARPATGWGMFLFGGILSIVLGYIIYSGWPLTGAWVVGTLVGIRLLFGGFTMMAVGGAASRVGSAMG
ncbi:MAG: HdeD family acid-resistance protein [Acidobacteriota bacterium]|jgi:uncharacterized membrane protein HdeD (DUF308 family)